MSKATLLTQGVVRNALVVGEPAEDGTVEVWAPEGNGNEPKVQSAKVAPTDSGADYVPA